MEIDPEKIREANQFLIKQICTPPTFEEFADFRQKSNYTNNAINNLKDCFRQDGCLNIPKLLDDGIIKIQRDPIT